MNKVTYPVTGTLIPMRIDNEGTITIVLTRDDVEKLIANKATVEKQHADDRQAINFGPTTRWDSPG